MSKNLTGADLRAAIVARIPLLSSANTKRMVKVFGEAIEAADSLEIKTIGVGKFSVVNSGRVTFKASRTIVSDLDADFAGTSPFEAKLLKAVRNFDTSRIMDQEYMKDVAMLVTMIALDVCFQEDRGLVLRGIGKFSVTTLTNRTSRTVKYVYRFRSKKLVE